MIEFTNADTGYRFLISPELIKSVSTDKDRNVFVWVDLTNNTGYRVKETYNAVRKVFLKK